MKKNLLRLGKLLLAVCLIAVIYNYFFHFENLEAAFRQLSRTPWYIYLIALISAFANWLLETFKWKNLLQNLQTVSVLTAFKSTCAGAAVSNIFPFRIGEYLGRMVYVKPIHHVPAIFNSVFGSTVQFIISVSAGIPASLFILSREYSYLRTYAATSAGISLLLFLFFFMYFRRITESRFPWINRLAQDIRKFTFRQILIVLLLSATRYLVYGGFYTWIIVYFGVTADAYYALAGVATIYLMQSFAPSMILTDAGLRTALPLLVFGGSPATEAHILAAALLNYGFNILLPSITGLFFIIAEKVRTT